MNMRERIVRDDMRERILGVGAVTGEGGDDRQFNLSFMFVSNSSLPHVRL